MASVAIAILNYNGEEHLARFLPSIVEHASDYPVIIGDNGSTDNSLKIIAQNFPSVKVIVLEENYGYAGGYNRLIQSIDEEYIILVNSDVETTKGWIDPLLAVMKKDPTVAAVQPKILSYTSRNYFEYAGAGGGFIDKYGYPFCRGRVFNSLEEDNGQYNDECSVFWASGACFMVKNSVFKELGGFDETFFAHMEEIDLNWRMQAHGYGIKYTGASVVYHLGGGTLSYSNPRKTYLNFRNSWATLIKNYGKKMKFNLLISRYIMDFLSILYFLFKFQFTNVLAVVKAHFYIATNYGTIKQTGIQSKLSARNNSIIEPENFSLVWQYFVRGKRKFSALIPNRTSTS